MARKPNLIKENREPAIALIASLWQIQQAHRWDDAAMAEHLGVTRSAWSSVRNGTANLGARPLGRVVINFPGLKEDVAEYLADLARLEVLGEFRVDE